MKKALINSLKIGACALGLLASGCATSLVAPDEVVTKLAGGFKFTEGPAADSAGNVYFSDIPNEKIHIWTTDGALKTFRKNTGRANGNFFDEQGNLLSCEGGARRVTSTDMSGNISNLVDAHNGKMLNSPNDLWIDPKGGIYFTDPRYGNMDGLEQGGFHVYYLTPDRKYCRRVADDLEKPNGLVGTPDGTRLYVADPGAGRTYVYSIRADGRLANRKLFVTEGSDGMTIDNRGNVYVTRNAVLVFNEAGRRIDTIETPERPANVCFGGPNRDTLFITARTSIYAVKMGVTGY
jgi:gluconolactonase